MSKHEVKHRYAYPSEPPIPPCALRSRYHPLTVVGQHCRRPVRQAEAIHTHSSLTVNHSELRERASMLVADWPRACLRGTVPEFGVPACQARLTSRRTRCGCGRRERAPGITSRSHHHGNGLPRSQAASSALPAHHTLSTDQAPEHVRGVGKAYSAQGFHYITTGSNATESARDALASPLARQPVHPVELAEFAACCRQPVKLSPWTIACLSPPLILSVYWDFVSLTPQNCYRFSRLSDGGPRSRSQRYRSMFKLSPTGVSGTLLLRKIM